MNRKHLLQLVTLLTLGLSACRVPVPTIEVMPSTTPESQGMPTPDTVDVSPIKAANYPRVDGSTSTYPMQVMIACVILEVSCDWTDGDYFNATRRISPRNLLNTSDANEVIFNLGHSGTHGAYMSLIESQADLALVAREPSADELDAALHEAVNLDVRPVALDAFVFLVHRDNPVPSLTLDQIRAIYTGEITNWSQVGGIDAEIHTYQRNPNSGSQELMEKLVMRDEQMLNSPDMILMSMMGPFSAIRDDPLGIGYSVYFYAANIFPDENVRMLAIGGVDPSTESIAADEYPLVTEVYAVMRNEALAPATALILRDWLLTADGQLAVQASGYVGRRNGSNPGGG